MSTKLSFDLSGQEVCVRNIPGYVDVQKTQFYCPISSIPVELDKWLGPNPRLSQPSPIHTGILNTITNTPELMVIKNAGLIIAADSAVIKNWGVEIDLSHHALHGVIDGNNTRSAIAKACEDSANPEKAFERAFIEISIYTGLKQNGVSAVAVGQNIRKPVQKYSILNLTGYFQDLKEGLGNRTNEISYFEGDAPALKTMDVKLLLQILMSLNVHRFPDETVCPILYAHAGKCLQYWEDDYQVVNQSDNCPSQILAEHSLQILEAYETIIERIPQLWNKGGRWGTVETKAHKVIGLVVLQAMRPIVSMNLRHRSFRFITDVGNVLDGCGVRLVAAIRNEYLDGGHRRADSVGKTSSLYDSTYGKVESWAIKNKII